MCVKFRKNQERKTYFNFIKFCVAFLLALSVCLSFSNRQTSYMEMYNEPIWEVWLALGDFYLRFTNFPGDLYKPTSVLTSDWLLWEQ